MSIYQEKPITENLMFPKANLEIVFLHIYIKKV